MIRRIKQFIKGVKAHLTEDDHQIIKKYLTNKEQEFFFAMHIVDQYHSMNVFKTAYKYSKNYDGVNKLLLYKLCLLHDIGREKNEISIWGKVFPVLFPFILKTDLPNWGRQKLKAKNHFLKILARFFNFFYLYKNHPSLSRKKLDTIKINKEDIFFYNKLKFFVENHHTKNIQAIEFQIFQRADNEN